MVIVVILFFLCIFILFVLFYLNVVIVCGYHGLGFLFGECVVGMVICSFWCFVSLYLYTIIFKKVIWYYI